MKEFNAKDLVIYFLVRPGKYCLKEQFCQDLRTTIILPLCPLQQDYPDNEVISSTFKDPSHDIQASIIGLGNLMDIPDHYYRYVLIPLGHSHPCIDLLFIYPRSEVPSVKLVLLENSSSSTELEAISARENWNLVNVWLVGLPPKQENDNRTASQTINELFKNVKLTYTAQVYVFYQDAGKLFIVLRMYAKKLFFSCFVDKVFLYETYKITDTNIDVEVLSYGFWSKESKLEADASHLWHRRANLKGKHLR